MPTTAPCGRGGERRGRVEGVEWEQGHVEWEQGHVEREQGHVEWQKVILFWCCHVPFCLLGRGNSCRPGAVERCSRLRGVSFVCLDSWVDCRVWIADPGLLPLQPLKPRPAPPSSHPPAPVPRRRAGGCHCIQAVVPEPRRGLCLSETLSAGPERAHAGAGGLACVPQQASAHGVLVGGGRVGMGRVRPQVVPVLRRCRVQARLLVTQGLVAFCLPRPAAQPRHCARCQA